jgi:hypothetical protein
LLVFLLFLGAFRGRLRAFAVQGSMDWQERLGAVPEWRTTGLPDDPAAHMMISTFFRPS